MVQDPSIPDGKNIFTKGPENPSGSQRVKHAIKKKEETEGMKTALLKFIFIKEPKILK